MRYTIPDDIKSYFEVGERTILTSSKEAAEKYFNENREELDLKNKEKTSPGITYPCVIISCKL